MAKNFFINNFKVRNGTIFIIAEGGVNHNGRLDLALKLIEAAADSGADAIKFQTWKAEQLVTKEAEMAGYQIKNLGKKESQYEMLKKLELKEQWYPSLIKRAKEKKIILLSAPHGGFEAIDLMQRFNFPAFKIASGDITNIPLLEYTAKLGKPMLISTGMSTMKEVKEAVDAVRATGNNKILVFQCSTDYPLSFSDVNLNVIKTYKEKLDVLVGYSDHTIGDQIPIMAVTLGASMVEKHFTLNRKMKGPDHIASMEPQEFNEMVEKLRRIPEILGSKVKKPQAKELQYIPVARKSIIAKRKIKKGEVFGWDNLAIKRPGTGMLPKKAKKILGKKAKVDIEADMLLSKKMIA